MIYFAYATAWISAAAAAGVGIYFTHSPWCLLALIFPAGLRIRYEPKNGKNREESEE